MKPELIAPDGTSAKQWCESQKKRKILDTQSITDEFTIKNDSPYWLYNFKLTDHDGMSYETPRLVPPYSDTAKLRITFDGKSLYENLIQEITTNISCESHVVKP